MPIEIDFSVYREATSEESRRAQMDVLSAVDEFCRANQIHYFLYYGSLLGAVRHKGYIPWDDDIDIAMPRKDYDRFVETFQSETIQVEAQEKTENYPFYFAKVFQKDTLVVEDMGKEGCAYGAGIDLFPLDAIPTDPGCRRKMLSAIGRRVTLRNVRCVPLYKKRRPLKSALVKILYTLCSGFSASKLMRKVRSIVQQYEVYPSDSVADIMLPYGERSIVKTEWIAQTVPTDFEGRKFCIPKDYDAVLTRIYGDYMTLPPKERQIPRHDIAVYIKK